VQIKFYIKIIICNSTQNMTSVEIKYLLTKMNFASCLEKKKKKKKKGKRQRRIIEKLKLFQYIKGRT
jgi:hypothetical protein